MFYDHAKGRAALEADAAKKGGLPRPPGAGWQMLVIDGAVVGWYRPPSSGANAGTPIRLGPGRVKHV